MSGDLGEHPEDQSAKRPEPIPLLVPRSGVPEVIDTPDGVRRLADRLADGTGPVAVDAERASGFRYSARAQLVQIHRRGSGLALVDPIAAGDLSIIGEALEDTEWVVHAAVADLACLAEVGMRPDALFDTELGGRIAGFDRVSLGAMSENLLGLRLAKGHSAADWSIRPLPKDFLVYAALDVDILLDLRDEVEQTLEHQGKLEWAHQEFEAVRQAPPPSPRKEPWRRTSGLQQVRNRRGMAIVRALWEARDTLARERDIAPGRLLPDRAISAAGAALPDTLQKLLEVDGFTRRNVLPHRRRWFAAVQSAWQIPERQLPTKTPPFDPDAGPSRSMGRDNDVADRYALAREVVLRISDEVNIPPENLIPPAAVRSLAWSPPSPIQVSTVAAQLQQHGARPWQITAVAAALTAALATYTPREA